MLIELIEKKNMPTKMKISFTKKEWSNIPHSIKEKYSQMEFHETKTKVYFILEGDLLNANKEKTHE